MTNAGGSYSCVHERLVVLLAQSRDPAAFQELVTRYERRVLYYVRRIVGESSESLDVLQEIWLKVFTKLPGLRSPEAFRVFLYRLAHDCTVDWLRRKCRLAREMPEASLTEEIADCWNEQEALDQVELAHRLLGELSPSHREVLTLRFLESMEISEIAAVTGCHEGTIKSRLHYARLALRRRWEASINEC